MKLKINKLRLSVEKDDKFKQKKKDIAYKIKQLEEVREYRI